MVQLNDTLLAFLCGFIFYLFLESLVITPVAIAMSSAVWVSSSKEQFYFSYFWCTFLLLSAWTPFQTLRAALVPGHMLFFFFFSGKCSISNSQRSLTNLVEVKAYVTGYAHQSSGGFYGKGGVSQKAALLLLFNKKSLNSFWKISEGRKASRSIYGFPKSHVLFAVRWQHCSQMRNLWEIDIHRNV